MGQNPKSFDDVIEQLRKGEGKGIAVQEDGKLLPWRPGPEAYPGTTPADTPTPTRKVVWGAGRWADPVAHQFFAAEQQVMGQRFPGFAVTESIRKPGHIAWHGQLTSNYGNTYAVEIVHRPSYPQAEPWVWVLHPHLAAGTPHIGSEGSLSVHVAWTPYSSTAVGVVAATAEWLLLYDHWRATGQRW